MAGGAFFAFFLRRIFPVFAKISPRGVYYEKAVYSHLCDLRCRPSIQHFCVTNVLNIKATSASFGLGILFSDFELRISELSGVSHSQPCR